MSQALNHTNNLKKKPRNYQISLSENVLDTCYYWFQI